MRPRRRGRNVRRLMIWCLPIESFCELEVVFEDRLRAPAASEESSLDTVDEGLFSGRIGFTPSSIPSLARDLQPAFGFGRLGRCTSIQNQAKNFQVWG